MDKTRIKVDDLFFQKALSAGQIKARVKEIAAEVNRNVPAGEIPVFIGIMTGSFRFMADFMHYWERPCLIDFIKVHTYKGLASGTRPVDILGQRTDLKDRYVVIIEDIVDSGNTLHHVLGQLRQQKPQKVEIATIFYKPEAFRHDYTVQYVGFSIPDKFIVGYGLDYNGLGRQYDDIYELAPTD